MARRFTRFRPEPDPSRLAYAVPGDGLCLSTFLVLRPAGHPERALIGHIDPTAPWQEIGSADARRVQEWSKGWMLPSCQLVFYESPEVSARRIAREQLGLTLGSLPAPVLMSDAYDRGSPTGDLHWDIGFVYVLDGQAAAAPRHSAWSTLEYREISQLPASSFVRFQGDVLRLVGMPPTSE